MQSVTIYLVAAILNVFPRNLWETISLGMAVNDEWTTIDGAINIGISLVFSCICAFVILVLLSVVSMRRQTGLWTVAQPWMHGAPPSNGQPPMYHQQQQQQQPLGPPPGHVYYVPDPNQQQHQYQQQYQQVPQQQYPQQYPQHQYEQYQQQVPYSNTPSMAPDSQRYEVSGSAPPERYMLPTGMEGGQEIQQMKKAHQPAPDYHEVKA